MPSLASVEILSLTLDSKRGLVVLALRVLVTAHTSEVYNTTHSLQMVYHSKKLTKNTVSITLCPQNNRPSDERPYSDVLYKMQLAVVYVGTMVNSNSNVFLLL